MVKIIRLVSGEEICCIIPKEQVKDKSHLLRLSEPMLIKYVPQITEFGISDYIALVKWVGFTNDKIITIPMKHIDTRRRDLPWEATVEKKIKQIYKHKK